MRLEAYETGALPPAIAMVAVASVLLALVAAVVVCLLRARKRTALARTAEASAGDHPPALVEGADVVLAGVVRHFEDHAVAVRVSVRQVGMESESSGSWSHSWTEIDREIVVAPFLLELATGQLVLVQPPKQVEVADALDQKVWIDRTERVLSAELVPGERIFARGRLQRSDQATPGGAYREVEWGWALHAAEGQMLLSSEPLGLGLRERAAFHRNHCWTALVLLVVTQLTLAGFYGRLAGHTEVATVSGKTVQRTTDSDDEITDHCMLGVRGREVEIDCGDHGRIAQGSRIPIRIASEHNWELGSAATIHWLHALILAAVTSAFWIIYRARRRSSRPWFRRRLHDSGAGRLPDPPP